MEIIRNGHSCEKAAIALGNFDGLHIAHQKVINNAIEYAKKNKVKSAVLLFCQHTSRAMGKNVRLIMDEEQKIDLLEKLGVDIVYMRSFDKPFMNMSTEEFGDYIIENLNGCAVSVGYDYRFGKMASGDVKTMMALGKKNNFDVLTSDEVDYDGGIVKSTKIRGFIESGEIKKANELLTRPFMLCGKVVKGLQNGRKLGFPTVNIEYSSAMVLPKNGVYRGYTLVDGVKYKSVINVGNNPTFSADRITVESHILDFNDDVYGKYIKVEFYERLRDDKKFDSIDELKAQILKDIRVVREVCI